MAKLNAKNAFALLVDSGAKTYSSTPVYALDETLGEIHIADEGFSVTNNDNGHSIRVDIGGDATYVAIKRQSDASKEIFELARFEASRDVEEYGITEGDTKLFAH
ncbi:MAG: hypothetical protein V3S79_02880 [Candidatus Thermoplasmatota archaeon]